MSHYKYRKLLEDFCGKFCFDDVDVVVAGGAIELNGLRFSLFYDEVSHPDTFFIYCEWGPLPLGLEAEAGQLFLRKNLFSYHNNGPIFSIAANTGKVVLVQRELLYGMSADVFSNKLNLLSAQAKLCHEELRYEKNTLSV